MSSDNSIAYKEFAHIHPAHIRPGIEGKEISIIDIFLTLLNYKHFIIALPIIASTIALIGGYLATNIYRSEAIIGLREEQNSTSSIGALAGFGGIVASQLGLSGGGSLEKLEVVLNSRDLNTRVINKYNLMPILFSDDWNAESKGWTSKSPPTVQDAQKKIRGLLNVRVDYKKNTILLAFEYTDPEIAKNIVDFYLTELSSSLREEVLHEATENLRFFKLQLEKTGDALLREKIYAFLAKEIEKLTFAKAQKYYGFLVLDPPVASDMNKQIKPDLSLIFFLTLFASFFCSVFCVFFIELYRKAKIECPEKFQQLIDGLRTRKRVREN